jgi:hypothetical protein
VIVVVKKIRLVKDCPVCQGEKYVGKNLDGCKACNALGIVDVDGTRISTIEYAMGKTEYRKQGK